MQAEALLPGWVDSASQQWHRAGGHILKRTESEYCAPSCEAFTALQCAAALDAHNEQLRLMLRQTNQQQGPQTDASAADVTAKRTKGLEGKGSLSQAPDDDSDGSPIQAQLVATNIRPGKLKRLMHPEETHVDPNGDPRLVERQVLASAECEQLIASGLVAMAGAFARCGQTTLGVSPALSTRMRDARSSLQLSSGLPLLYMAIERARRCVSRVFNEELHALALSDATLTRLQPVADDLTQASSSGALDVGVMRGDRFVYWRPHVDQVSVAEYDYSALLYLTKHGADGDFEGGVLTFHDAAEDCEVLPEPGLLVSFRSGPPNLHSVSRVSRGSRFALTMWFTTQRAKRQKGAGAADEHEQMQDWAERAVSAQLTGKPPPPLPACVESPDKNMLPAREAALASAALTSLPANDPLGRGILLAHSLGSAVLETLRAGLAPHGCSALDGFTLDPFASSESPCRSGANYALPENQRDCLNSSKPFESKEDFEHLRKLLAARLGISQALAATLARAQLTLASLSAQSTAVADVRDGAVDDGFDVFD
mmetsp:Transcript_27238/g.57271  ORF Transcript_27238/g.57271 Transcript_27238/m.57271 type:complete len:541 (-) Transcript_27238:404-2026(-)